MSNHNAVIKGVSYFHPTTSVDNEYYINHFKDQGTDISGLLACTGRNTRYISTDMNETVLTMGLEAVKKVLEETKVDPKELNIIAFSTGTPEYFAPSHASKIHASIRAGQQLLAYDVNANCVGMLVTLEQVSRTMRDNPRIKYALVVGSDQLSRYSRYSDPITYSNFGDSACAVILENVSNTDSGLIDSDYYTNSTTNDNILLPAKGMSSVIHNKELDIYDKLVQWVPFNTDGGYFSASVSINNLLERNNITKKDIKKYFLTQFSYAGLEQVAGFLDEDVSKFSFIGDEFGYTGTTSPLLAYAKELEKEKFNPGDYIIFWSVGSGLTSSGILYRC